MENDNKQFIAAYMTEIWNELTAYLLQNPEKLASCQMNYWQSYLNFCQEFTNNQNQPEDATAYDKRFQHADWHNNLTFNFIQRSYQFLSEQVDHLANELDITDTNITNKLQFVSRQYIDSISPSNFVNTNPEVLSKTMETNGVNLIQGFKQFREDLERGQGKLQTTMTDSSHFELGKNIACTPGKVIYQNDMMQLIQYHSTTEQAYEIPLLIMPPWINKYYILDLQSHNSLVKWLVDRGHTVFLISWVNPDHTHKDTHFSDYLVEGPLAALEIIKKISASDKVNLLGYCIGGTLLGCLLAYLAKLGNEDQIASATFLTTLFDFSHPGELGTFIDDKQISMLEDHMNKSGYLDGHILASVFNALKANDLIWSAFVNNYLKGQKAQPFDLLHWNSDSTNVPAAAHSFYLRNFYLDNNLIQPETVTLNDVTLDLQKIKTTSYFLATRDDHIVPWQSAYQSYKHVNATAKFVLAGSGHVAGVINPPQNEKYGYWTNNANPVDADTFLASANFHKGSWWNDWHSWLKTYSGKLVSAHQFDIELKKSNENAPGSYVKVRIDN